MADALPQQGAHPFSVIRGRRRLIVASNRLALPGSVQTGGLATALTSALQECGGTWVGWTGKVGHAGETSRRNRGTEYLGLSFSVEEHAGHYLGYANRILWPLLHSRVELVDFEPEDYRMYRDVNARFADAILKAAGGGAIVWVHDFHLLQTGELLRKRGFLGPIGFFLHTPFPAPDIARCLPGHEQVLGALRHFDLVGVQTERDASHLRAYLHECFGEDPGARVAVFPIGVDAHRIAADAEAPASQAAARRLRQSLEGRRLVIGVDRLDYTKGLPTRFRAYGKMLEHHPELCGKVSYLQIAPISRGEVAEYRDLKRGLDRLAGSLNARHGDVDWVPLRYVAKAVPHAVVAALMREAAVGLVTPLRDGMNLVAKEFVAAQRPEDPGVLVLSEFAGAARQLDAALTINPYDPCAVADTLARALAMPLPERRRRWERLIDNVTAFSLTDWRRDFLAMLEDTTAFAAVDALKVSA